LSDDNCYAIPVAKKFDYTNTYYDREPFLDLTAAHPELYGTHDFILSSDVFEHIPAPIERALEEAIRLLKPGGFLCITVPSTAAGDRTVEYYPELHEYSIVPLAGEYVLINRKKDKSLEIHQDLEFHGGIGATLVMRTFSQKDLARKLRGVGFRAVEFLAQDVEGSGIFFEGTWSRPLMARKGGDMLSAAEVPEAESGEAPPAAGAEGEVQITRLHNEKAALERRVAALESQLRIISDSRWLKLGQRLGFGFKPRV
jgi:hypothetical protein